jgi:hypothetical protein
MAETTTLSRADWKTTLNRLAAQHSGTRVAIEAVDPDVGYQRRSERLPFFELAYDSDADVIRIAFGGLSPQYPVVLRHLIWHPVELGLTTVPEPAVRIVEPDASTTFVVFYPKG